MEISSAHWLFLILQALLSLLPLLVSAHQLQFNHSSDSFLFPPNFLFGAASSAYQYEGGFMDDGKGLNNWDVFSHKSGKVDDGSNGDVAVDEYHRYQEHINIMASMGLNSYQFSISWARILPKGRYGPVNLAGIDYYNKLIDALILKGIQPVVALSHYDIPIELEDRYGAWLSPESVEDFKYLADICFKNFGDRVKHWFTFSEPNVMVIFSYRTGTFPPNRCSKPFGDCAEGDSEKEPFIAAHNIILAHAAAVKVYKTKYQVNVRRRIIFSGKRTMDNLVYIVRGKLIFMSRIEVVLQKRKEQGGGIGFIVQTIWYEPISNSTLDKLAAERAQSFFSNWFLDPIIFGRYPTEMIDILGSTLPTFSENDLEDLKMGLDFIGINHYYSLYVQDCLHSSCESLPGTSRTEGFTKTTNVKNGIPIGEPTGASLTVFPQGMERTVTYIKERYNNIPIFITENGYCDFTNSSSTLEESLNDVKRVDYLSSYLDALSTAMRKGADVRGYFVWTLLDIFEWLYGYTKRYGIHHVDRSTLKITPKLSATWYIQFIANQTTIRTIIPETSVSYGVKI